MKEPSINYIYFCCCLYYETGSFYLKTYIYIYFKDIFFFSIIKNFLIIIKFFLFRIENLMALYMN